jgi:hypothetical protein
MKPLIVVESSLSQLNTFTIMLIAEVQCMYFLRSIILVVVLVQI